VCEVAYRPFDVRWAFLHPSLCHRPRPPLLAATAQSSLVLVSVRQDRGSLPWSHVALVSHPIDNCYLSARSSCRARAFPTHGGDGVRNVSPRLWRLLGERGIEAEPRSIVAYLAAVLSSRVYVRAHADALALDYPRVPLPRDASVLATLAALGERLAACLATTAEPVRARAGCELVRVGHHAFDPSLPAVAALSSVRHEIDAAFGVLRLAECSEKN
jgi:predicted helicase